MLFVFRSRACRVGVSLREPIQGGSRGVQAPPDSRRREKGLQAEYHRSRIYLRVGGHSPSPPLCKANPDSPEFLFFGIGTARTISSRKATKFRLLKLQNLMRMNQVFGYAFGTLPRNTSCGSEACL